MSRCLIGLGSNLGDRQANLESAIDQFDKLPNVSVMAVSRWFGTNPIGGPKGQGEFLNGAAILATTLPPVELLRQLRDVESFLGRERRIRWDARTIDVDILLYDEVCVEQAELTIPHPRMNCRRFVLEPAAEIASEWKHPILDWTIGKLLDHLNTKPPRFALCGFESLGLGEIAKNIADEVGIGIESSTGRKSGRDCSADNLNLTVKSGEIESNLTPTCGLFLVDTTNDATAVSPKLLIVPTALGTAEQQRIIRELETNLIELRLAPVLTITSSDHDVVTAESVAAIEAMK